MALAQTPTGNLPQNVVKPEINLLTGPFKEALPKEVTFPNKEGFFFGVSNAPTQVEDQLSDIWMDFADMGKIPAFFNYGSPKDRIQFWSNPEQEILLAKQLGVEVFRMGVDWQRLFPVEGKLDVAALDRYKYILQLVHKHGMKVMLTLFHHSEPRYTFQRGSWRNKQIIQDFRQFWLVVLETLSNEIDYLVTFNESNVYVLASQVGGVWPSYHKANSLGLFNFGPIKGRYEKSLRHMATSHKEIYDWVKAHKKTYPVGIAHNVGYYHGENKISQLFAKISWNKFNYKFLDMIASHSDYLGINYYGIEVVKGFTVHLSPNYEYSDSGRGIYPEGLYKILKDFHFRYNKLKKNRLFSKTSLPMIITENGVADGTDTYRPLYLTEHLAAVKKAMDEGVSVLGYIQWTLTDNFEWTDGYCPKFGMVGVNRDLPGMPREIRPSFYFYQNLIATRSISAQQREQYRHNFKMKIGTYRGSCRAENGLGSLPIPRADVIRDIDWNFNL